MSASYIIVSFAEEVYYHRLCDEMAMSDDMSSPTMKAGVLRDGRYDMSSPTMKAGVLRDGRYDMSSPTMKAGVLRDGKICFEATYPIPTPKCGEALIHVKYCGVCGTDHELVGGYKGDQTPEILGHELFGVVVKFGPGTRDKERYNRGDAFTEIHTGDYVVAEINCVDHKQYTLPVLLKPSERTHHPDRSVIGILKRNGAFAEYVCVPVENLYSLIDHDHKDMVRAEPLAAACRILEQFQFNAEDKVAIIGAGRLGRLVVQTLQAGSPCTYITVFLRECSGRHFEFLRSKMGGNLEYKDTKCIKQEDENSYDTVIDCSGSPTGFNVALTLVRPKGIVVLKSTVTSNKESDVAIDWSKIAVKEIKVQGSRCGPFTTALHMLLDKRVNIDVMERKVFSIEEIADAFGFSMKNNKIKTIIEMPKLGYYDNI